MPPAAKRDIAVIVFDLDQTNKEFYEESLSFLFDLISREWFYFPKNSVKLLLFNSEESKNRLHKPNIHDVFQNFVQFNPNIIKKDIEDAKYVKNKATWMDAVTLGLTILSNEIDTHAGIISAQLLLISKNYSNVTSTLDKDLKAAIKTQNKYGIKIIVTGLPVSVGFIENTDELKVWARIPVILEEINKESKNALVMMCEQSETLICDLNMGRDLLFAFRTKRMMYPWKVSLSIGSSFGIPISMHRKLKAKGSVSIHLPRKLDPNYYTWVCVEDEKRIVNYNDVIRGALRWGKFIGFDDNLKKYFKVEGPKNFTLRGFTEKRNIRESIFLEDGTSTLAPDPKVPHSRVLLYLLYKCLLESDKVGIASKAYARNCRPRLVALIPDKKHETILVNRLPYADDIISSFTEKASENCKTIDEQESKEEKEVSEFLNSLKVPLEDFHLGPELSFNPRSAQMARKIAEKFLGIDKSLGLNIKLPYTKGSTFESSFPVTKQQPKENEISKDEVKVEEEMDDDYLL